MAGPVVACAAHIPPLIFPLVSPFINDSKKLTPSKRETAFSAMLQAGVSFGFGWATHQEIDRCNILEATFNAMGTAVKRLARTLSVLSSAGLSPVLSEAERGLPLRHVGKPNTCVGAVSEPMAFGRPPVVSPRNGPPHPLCGSRGNRSAVSPQLSGKGANPFRPQRCKLPFDGLFVLVDGPHKIKRLDVDQRAVVGGDGRSLSIAAASIFAKVLRDRWMAHLESQYPGYGFAVHKGYGTAAHLAALHVLGPSPIHRFSFAPVKMANMKLESRSQKSEF